MILNNDPFPFQICAVWNKKNPSRSLPKPSRYDINVQDCVEQSFPTSSKCLNPNWRSRRHHKWKRGYKSETKLKKFKTVGCGCSVDFCISRKTRTWHSFWTSVETLLKRWVEGALTLQELYYKHHTDHNSVTYSSSTLPGTGLFTYVCCM